MMRRFHFRWLLVTFFLIPFISGKAQPPPCNGFFDPDTLSINCGDTVLLDPIVGSSLLGDDFNDSTLNAGWYSNQTVTYYDSLDCLEDPVNDGSTFAWMGPFANQPRIFQTAEMDVACGGQVCFDFIMGSENQSGEPCEGPDQFDEGVALQYSIDNGNTWNDIYYFNPDTACCGCGGGGCNGEPPSPFVEWSNYCFNIPPGAQTDTTEFRFFQDQTSGTDFDHWGLDNVFFIGSVCDSGALKYSYDSGATYMSDPDTLVYPPLDTGYTLFITDTNYTDTCYADVFVEVDKPEIDATPMDTLICDNDTTQLYPQDSCYYVLDMQDALGDGWNGADIEVYVNGTSIGTFSATGVGTIDSFKVAVGDSIALDYSAGTAEDEVTYDLYDATGNLLFSDGPFPSTGIVYTQANTVCGVNTPNYDFDWDPDSSLANANTQDPIAFPDTTTQYVLTLENMTTSKCNVSDTTEVVVEPYGGNTSFTYGSGTFCWDDSNQTPTINGVPGGTFYSSPSGLDLDSTTGVVDISNSVADSSYTVYYKTPGTKCSFTDSVPFTIDTNSNAEFHYADTVYCETSGPVSPTFLNNGSAGNFWANKSGLALDSTYGTVDIPNSDTGSYWVYNEIPVSGSCPTDLDSAKLVIEVKPLVDAGMGDTICESDSVNLDGSYSGGSSKATWVTLGDGSFDDPNDTNATYTPGPNDKNNGTVILVIESDSIKACNVERDTIMVEVKAEPTLDVGKDDTICADEAADLSASLGGSATGVKWNSSGDGFFDDSTSSVTSYHPGSNDKDSGTVTLYAETKGVKFCSPISDSLELTVVPLADPSFSYPKQSVCEGDDKLTPTIQGDSGGVFTADPPGGLDLDSNSGEIDPSNSYDDFYTITYTVGDQCPNDTTITFTVNPQPDAPSPDPLSLCPGETGDLSVDGDPDSTVWYDDPNGNNVVGTDSVFSPDPQNISQPGVYTYYVKIYEKGCVSPLGSVDVTVNDYADVDILSDPDPAVGVKPFTVIFKNGSGTNVVDFDINFGNGTAASDSTWSDTSVTYPKKGTYKVTMTGIDTVTGCSGSDELIVEVVEEAQAQLPNVFTPNGDGENEVFMPKLGVPCPDDKKSGHTCWNGIKSFQGTIFNRWGNKVYQWSDWNDPWDGGGSPSGTYYYVIEATGENGEKVEYKGQVTLLRNE